MTAHYKAPGWFTRNVFNRAVSFLTRHGVSVLGSRVLAVKGRTSGEWRTVPVNLLELDGHRYLVSPRGEGQWVRNLRAAGTATITVRGRREEVTAIEQDRDQRLEFFRDILPPIARRIPFGVSFIRYVDGTDLSDPMAAADGRPVFELRTR